MAYNINFDIASIVIILLVLSAAHRRHMITGVANRAFFNMMEVTAAAAVFDIISVIASDNTVVQWITHIGFHLMQQQVTPLLVIYIVAISEAMQYFRQRKQRIIFCIPFAIITLMIVTTPFTGLVFDIDGDNFYKGPFYNEMYLVSLIYVGFACFYLVKYKQNLAKGSIRYLTAAFPIVALAVFFQFIWPDQLLQCFAISIVLLLYTVTVQRPEVLLDNETKLYNKGVFMKYIQQALATRTSLALCLFKIEKSENYMATLSVDRYNAMLNAIAKGIRTAVKIVDKDLDVYYLKHGLYAVVARYQNRYKADRFMETADHEILRALESASLMMNTPNIYKCTVMMPEEISEFSSLPSFLDGLENILPRSGPIYRISDMEDNDKINLHININATIERALRDGEFSVRYAPIYDPVQDKIVAGNAQLYINDSRYGEIEPQFIWRMAESSGEIARLSDMMYDRVCRFVAGADFKESKLRYIQLKLSATSFEDQYLCSNRVAGADRYGVNPTNIAFSIAESSAITDWTEVAAQVQLLRYKGFKIGLEDYGAYNSNIRRISTVPFTALQLDAGLVRKGCAEAATEESGSFLQLQGLNELILTSTIDMVRGLGIKIIAAGVDDLQSKKFIEETGCEYMMGEYFGGYLPIHDFLHLVRSFNEKSERDK